MSKHAPARHRGGTVLARVRPIVLGPANGGDGRSAVCHLCDHAGARELDHVISLKDWPDQPVSAALMRPAHGTSAPCPTCGRKCNQERGTMSIEQARAKFIYTAIDW